LLQRSRHIDRWLHRRNFQDDHAFVLTEGLSARGVYGAGKFLADATPFRPGDVVGLCLDFEHDSASWYVNGKEAYTMHGLPDGELFAAVCLGDNEVYSEVRIAAVESQPRLVETKQRPVRTPLAECTVDSMRSYCVWSISTYFPCTCMIISVITPLAVLIYCNLEK